jgi:thioredoxin reductase (NADPH)
MITEDQVQGVPLFAALDDAQVRRIAARAADIRLGEGDWAAREGEAGAFYVLLEGRLEITKMVAGRQQSLAFREAGGYFGEVPLLLGAPFLASFRAVEPAHLLRLAPADFNALLQAAPSVRTAVTDALVSRVGGVEEATSAPQRMPTVVGERFDGACHDLRDFLARNFVAFEWLDPANADERPRIPAATLEDGRYPALVLPEGTLFVRPSLRVAAEAVGLRTVPAAAAYDVVIIGGGPSGLSAAVYGASEGLHTLMIEGTAPGGQAGTSSRIENYLGFPIGLAGDELGSRAFSQAQRFGAEIVVTRQVCSIEPGDGADGMHTLCLEDGVTIAARAIVLSVGATYRALNVPGIEPFVGAGVYYGAARTEAIGTRGCSIYLIGGGNSAGQAAMFFANYAARVTLLVRGPSLEASMSQYLIEQLATRANIVVQTNAEMVGVAGRSHLDEIEIRDRTRDRTERQKADGVFIFIGADANTGWLPAAVARDARGYVLTGADIPAAARDSTLGRDLYLLETSVPGIFAAGDVRHDSMKRVASAVGEGSMTIAFIHQYLAALSGAERVVSAVR